MYNFQKDILVIYQENLDQIVQEIKSKDGPLLKKIKLERDKSLQNIREKYKKNKYSRIINDNIVNFINYRNNKKYVLQEFPQIFKKYKDIELPFINNESILKKKIKKNPTDLILESGFFTSDELKDIEDIFSISRLNLSCRFRTIMEKNKLLIEGMNLPTIFCLAGVAHELGHCLYERNINRSAFLSPYYSEVIAHILEEKLITFILEKDYPHLKDKWIIYQRNIDRINIFFYLYEWKNIISTNFNELNFIGNGIYLRESLFVLPGFQSVYAYASIKRIELLKYEYKINELIRMFSNV